jgi:hypothetical protein
MKSSMPSAARATLCAAIGLLAAAGQAAAQSVVISNFSFENATGYWTANASPSSWVTDFGSQLGGLSFNQQVVGGAGAGLSGYQGNNVLSLNLDPGGSAASGTQWLRSVSLGLYQADSLYTLTVAMAKVNANESRRAIIALTAGPLANGAGSVTNTVAFTSVNATNLSAAFADFTVSLDTSANPSLVGEPIGVLLEHAATDGLYGREIYFDNVRLDVLSVPEPSAAALLLALAPAGLLLRRRG